MLRYFVFFCVELVRSRLYLDMMKMYNMFRSFGDQAVSGIWNIDQDVNI